MKPTAAEVGRTIRAILDDLGTQDTKGDQRAADRLREIADALDPSEPDASAP